MDVDLAIYTGEHVTLGGPTVGVTILLQVHLHNGLRRDQDRLGLVLGAPPPIGVSDALRGLDSVPHALSIIPAELAVHPHMDESTDLAEDVVEPSIIAVKDLRGPDRDVVVSVAVHFDVSHLFTLVTV